jgi:hypothetical protein
MLICGIRQKHSIPGIHVLPAVRFAMVPAAGPHRLLCFLAGGFGHLGPQLLQW